MTAIKIGYARVSTTDQDTELQIQKLREAGCEKIFHEQLSGAIANRNRPQLVEALAYARAGDTLVVTRIDRLARSISDLSRLVEEMEAAEITLQATEQPIDTTSAAGKAFLGMLGIFAEFEKNLIHERQSAGIKKAKAEGKYKGRVPKLFERHSERARQLRAEGMSKAAIARTLGIARSSVYQLLAE